MRHAILTAMLLTGCGVTPEHGDWQFEGTPTSTTCDVFPALPPALDILEADEGFTLALPDGSASAPCAQEGRTFACEPLAFEWRFSDGTVESFLDEELTVTGELLDDDEAEGTAVIALTCRDDECPNEGACSAAFAFTAQSVQWLDFD